MNKKANKKNIARRFLVAGFFVLLAFFSLLDSSPAEAVVNDYYKNATSTLTATEWNNLLLDFLNTGGGRINGSVGINTATSSSYILNVSGGGYFSQPVVVGTPTDVSHAATMGYINSVITGGSGSTVGYWAMNGTNISNTNAGNVGIGTTVPNGKLQITGSSSDRIILSNSTYDYNVNSPKLSFYGWSDNGIIAGPSIQKIGNYGNGAGRLSFLQHNVGDYINETEVMSIMPTGKVGIGNTNPSAPLSFSGATGGQKILLYDRDNLRHGLGVDMKDGWETDLFGATDGTNGHISLGFVSNTNGTTYTERARLTTAGNLGIGTTNPVQKLDVAGTDHSIRLYNSNSSLNASTSILFGANSVLPQGAAAIRSIQTGGSGNNYDTDLAFYTTLSGVMPERMRIAYSGNVGIGNTSPGAKLDVTGSFRNSLATTHTLLGSAGNVVVMADNTGTLYSTPLATFVSSNSLDLWEGAKNGNIWNGDAGVGNVGIGRTNPSQKLHVEGVSAAEAQFLNYEVNAPQIVLNHAAAGWGLIQNNAAGKWSLGYTGVSAFDTLGTSVLTWTNGGNVGIGTTNPGYKMDVVGQVYASNGFLLPRVAAGGSGNEGIGFVQSGLYRSKIVENGDLSLMSDDNIIFSDLNTDGSIGAEWMRINNGNVGIGATNPGTKLDVAGSFRNSLATTHSLLGNAGNVVVMADNTGTLYSTSTASFISGNSLDLWKGTKNGNIWNGDAGVGNVGVGTTNPVSKFQISGVSSNPSLTADDTSILSLVNSSNNLDLVFGQINVSPYTSWIQGRDALNNGNSYPIALNPMGGNVGVGTSNPLNKLQIGPNNASYSGNDLIISNANGTSAFHNSTTDFYYWSTLPISFRPGGNTAMWITTGGLVGIGTTNPGSLLEVNGSNPRVTSKRNTAAGNYASFLASSDTSGYPRAAFFIGDASGDSITNAGFTVVPDVTSAVQKTTFLEIKTNATNLAATKRFFMRQGTTNAEFITSVNDGNPAGAPLVFTTQGFSYTAPGIYISNAAAQNVGIGITDPGTKLDVSGSFRNSLATTHSLLGGSGNVVVMADNTGTLYSTSTASFIAGNSLDLWKGTKNGNIWNGDAGVGNVGIGTTNPLARLDINAGDNIGLKLTAVGSSDNVGTGIRFGYNQNVLTNDYFIGKIDAIKRAGGGGDLILNSASSAVAYNSNQLVLAKNGNVGIGTTTPAAMLDVFNVNSLNTMRLSGSQSPELYFRTSQGGNAAQRNWGIRTNHAGYGLMQFVASSDLSSDPTNTVMSLMATGNVGIGITNPGAKLDVVGSFRNSLATTHTLLGGAGNVVVMADNTGTLYSTSTASFISGNSLDLWKGTKNGNIWNGDAGVGNVGIGLTNPSEKLEVSGNIKLPTNSYIQGNSAGTSANGGYIVFTGESGVNAGYGTWVNQNAIWNGTTWLQPRGALGSYLFTSNHHLGWSWRYAANGGVDGGTITPTQKMSLDSAGNLTTVGNLTVQGTGNSSIAGNLGIGLTNPSKTFQIGNSSNSASIYNDYLGSINHTIFESRDNNDGGAFMFRSNSDATTTNLMTITRFGEVGIGTTAPGTKLDVSGSLRNSLATTHSLLGGAGNVVVMADNTGTLYSTSTTSFIAGNSLDLWKGTKNGNIWNGDAGVGNVGIGTNAPEGKLHIIGMAPAAPATTGTVPTGLITRLETNGTNEVLDIGSLGGGQGTWLQGTNRIALGGVYPILLNPNGGNVGIGTTNPTSLLHLNVASGDNLIKVNTQSSTSNWIGMSLTYLNSEYFAVKGNVNTGELRIGGINPSGYYTTIYSNGAQTMSVAAGNVNFPGSGIWNSSGNVGIGTTPNTKLSILGSDDASGQGVLELRTAGGTNMKMGGNTTYSWIQSHSSLPLRINDLGNNVILNSGGGSVGIGLTNPGTKLDVSGTSRNSLATTHSLLGAAGNVVVMADNTGTLYSTPLATFASSITGDYLPLSGGSLTGNLNMGGHDILNINKLTVNTIDPLYNIKGTNYSTFASSIAGGVKEEYIGRADIKAKSSVDGEREYVIDFDNIETGSDLWVWRQTVDFSDKNVEVLITPYGGFAQVYSSIENNKIIFKADRPVSVHYRLSGRRVDWKNWPTRAHNQTEKAGFVIE